MQSGDQSCSLCSIVWHWQFPQFDYLVSLKLALLLFICRLDDEDPPIPSGWRHLRCSFCFMFTLRIPLLFLILCALHICEDMGDWTKASACRFMYRIIYEVLVWFSMPCFSGRECFFLIDEMLKSRYKYNFGSTEIQKDIHVFPLVRCVTQ